MTENMYQDAHLVIKPLAEEFGVSEVEVAELFFMSNLILEESKEEKLTSDEIGKRIRLILEKLNKQ